MKASLKDEGHWLRNDQRKREAGYENSAKISYRTSVILEMSPLNKCSSYPE